MVSSSRSRSIGWSCAALDEREAGGVDPDRVQQVVERHDPPRALRHLAVAQAHELVDLDVDAVGVVPERLRGGLEPPDVAVVVGAEHVDRRVEPALELVDDVGQVAGDVREGAVRSLEDAVLVVAERGRPQPDGSVGLEHVPARSDALDRTVDRAALVQRALEEPGVERAPKPGQRRPDAADHGIGAGPCPCRGVRVRVEPEPGRDLGHILPLVAVGRRLLASRPGAQGFPEEVDLPAGVIEVVLPPDVVAGELEQPRQAVAVGGVTGGGHGHRAGGIARDVLDLHPLRPGRRARPVPRPLLEHPSDGVAIPGGGHAQVEEARPGDLDRRDVLRRDLGGDPRGDVARRRPQRLGELQRHRRRVVAVIGIGRPVEPNGDAVAADSGDRPPDGGGEFVHGARAHAVDRNLGRVRAWTTTRPPSAI